MAKHKRLSQRQIEKKIKSLIERHGKVRMTFQDSDIDPLCGCLCDQCRDEQQTSVSQRRRVIDKRGNCLVAYRGSEYRKWSGYQVSCFMDCYEGDYCTCSYMDRAPCNCKPEKKTINRTLSFMFEHDDQAQLQMVLIEYGKRFKKKVRV